MYQETYCLEMTWAAGGAGRAGLKAAVVHADRPAGRAGQDSAGLQLWPQVELCPPWGSLRSALKGFPPTESGPL